VHPTSLPGVSPPRGMDPGVLWDTSYLQYPGNHFLLGLLAPPPPECPVTPSTSVAHNKGLTSACELKVKPEYQES
jgi:hypothetical protein